MSIPGIGPFIEAAEFDGKIVSAVGAENGRILLERMEGDIISVECTAEMIKCVNQARTSSFRIMGHATWERSGAGLWKLIRFQATSFRVLRTENLLESIVRLKKIWNSGSAALDLDSNDQLRLD